MAYLANAPDVMPAPGDTAFRDGQLMRFDVYGWRLLETFQGDYDPEREYEDGDVVIRQGGVWIADYGREPGLWVLVAPPAKGY
jgi:hypothetical protein